MSFNSAGLVLEVYITSPMICCSREQCQVESNSLFKNAMLPWAHGSK